VEHLEERNARTFAGTEVLLLELKSIFFRLLFNWIRALGDFSFSSSTDLFCSNLFFILYGFILLFVSSAPSFFLSFCVSLMCFPCTGPMPFCLSIESSSSLK
jgi:hypothetical protein